MAQAPCDEQFELFDSLFYRSRDVISESDVPISQRIRESKAATREVLKIGYRCIQDTNCYRLTKFYAHLVDIESRRGDVDKARTLALHYMELIAPKWQQTATSRKRLGPGAFTELALLELQRDSKPFYRTIRKNKGFVIAPCGFLGPEEDLILIQRDVHVLARAYGPQFVLGYLSNVGVPINGTHEELDSRWSYVYMELIDALLSMQTKESLLEELKATQMEVAHELSRKSYSYFTNSRQLLSWQNNYVLRLKHVDLYISVPHSNDSTTTITLEELEEIKMNSKFVRALVDYTPKE